VKRGNDLVFHMESTFSISTNPELPLHLRPWRR